MCNTVPEVLPWMLTCPVLIERSLLKVASVYSEQFVLGLTLLIMDYSLAYILARVFFMLIGKGHNCSCVAFLTCSDNFSLSNDLLCCPSNWHLCGMTKVLLISEMQLSLMRYRMCCSEVLLWGESRASCREYRVHQHSACIFHLSGSASVCHKCTLLLKQKNVHPSEEMW